MVPPDNDLSQDENLAAAIAAAKVCRLRGWINTGMDMFLFTYHYVWLYAHALVGVTCSLQAMGSEICSYIHTLTRVHIVRVNCTTNWHSRPLIVEDFVQLQIFKYIHIYTHILLKKQINQCK